jgi:hypothetical protein
VSMIEITGPVSGCFCTGSDQGDLTVAQSGWHHLDFGRAVHPRPDTTETTLVAECGRPTRGPVARPRSLQ